jgi:alpha-galactosidase
MHRLSNSRRSPLLRVAATLCLLTLLARGIGAGAQNLAPTPPMGWNSWDAFGTTVREDEVKANADVMASKLKQVGWQYVVVDIQWYEPNAQAHGYRPNATLAMDDHGRLIPAANRFPSAANGRGFKALADYVHGKGLKFGIHILRGIPRQAVAQNAPILGTSLHAGDVADKNSLCSWNTDMYGVDMSTPGAQAYYDSIVAQYAHWGVDFIKADDMSRPYHKAEIEGLHQAIVHSGRPIVLSLSPGPAPLHEVTDLRSNAQMWRIEDDLWDNWKSVKNMNIRIEAWSKLVQPGGWPDADMLPLGRIGIRAENGDDRASRLTHDEQQTLMTLWCVFRSPLMFGGDLASLDLFTTSLLANGAVMSVDQHTMDNRLAYSDGDLRVWTAKSSVGASRSYVAAINLGDSALTVDVPWSKFGVEPPAAGLEDLWTGKTVTAAAQMHVGLAPHASVLYGLPAQGR